jgi:hypothetical protein
MSWSKKGKRSMDRSAECISPGASHRCTTVPASEARRQASRVNGRASRGPKTAAGKERSARNACRHGLSRPAVLLPELAQELATLARAIAGPGAGRERFGMACPVAAAQIDVGRVRQARRSLLAALPLDTSAIARAAALDRYERRALSRRKLAIRRFDAAFPSGVRPGDSKAVAMHRLRSTERTRRVHAPAPQSVRTNPGGWRPRATLRPNDPEGRGNLAKRTQGGGAAGPRFDQTNPRGFVRRTPYRPNELEGYSLRPSNLAERTRGAEAPGCGFAKTNPRRLCCPGSDWPNKPERCLADGCSTVFRAGIFRSTSTRHFGLTERAKAAPRRRSCPAALLSFCSQRGRAHGRQKYFRRAEITAYAGARACLVAAPERVCPLLADLFGCR